MRNTKDRIADTALRLFNETGTDGVSTNHIAAAMDISPGNLYYHFANKDEILRVLLERLSAGLESAWVGSPAPPGPGTLRPAVKACFALLEQYRFFSREVYALAHRSAALREKSRALSERCIRAIELSMMASVESGFWGHVPDRSGYRWLATALWLGVLSYSASQEVRSDAVESDAWSDGVDFVLALVEPHLQAEPRSGEALLGRVVHA